MTEQVVRVGGPADLVSSVPYVVGYHPRDALVVLGLRGPRRRLAATGCVPLPPRGSVDLVDEVVAAALGPVLGSGAERIVAVLYVRRRPPSTGALPERAVASAVRRCAAEAGAGVEDVIAVWDDRWWSYLCRDARCCPPHGRALPDPSTVPAVAALVLEGVAPAASRDALAASVGRAPGCPGDALAAAVRRRSDEVAGRQGPAARARTLAALGRLLDRGRGGEPPDDPDDLADVADVLVGLGDVGARDAAVRRAADGQPAETLEVLRWLVRVAPAEHAAPAATVLAATAYLAGNGALANVALDRALAADGAYSMALLLRALLACGVAPEELAHVVEDIRSEVVPPAG